MRTGRFRSMTVGAATLVVALAGQLVLVDTADAGPDANAPGTPALATEITNKFTSYGNSTSVDRWTGGDGLEAIELPDGRVLWFFNDYWYGTVKSNLTRGPFQASMPRNGIVIQNANGTMGQTVSGSGGATLMNTGSGWLWGGDQRLQGGTVQKFYMRMVADGGWGSAVGVELRTIPTGSVASPGTYGDLTAQLPADVRSCSAQGVAGHCTLWGMALADHGSYTYVYGADVSSSGKDLKIARVPQGDFAGLWEYWNGSGWSTEQADAIDTGTVASEAMSVTYQGGRWVLVGQDTHGGLGGNVISYYADTPWGFTAADKSTLFKMPETTADWSVWAYTPRLIPHLSTGGNQVIIGYSVNSQLQDSSCGAHNYIDATVYRPRFKAVTLPTTPGGSYQAPNGAQPAAKWLTAAELPGWCAPGTAAVPAPTGVTATPGQGNTALTFGWSQTAPSSDWSYGFQFRASGDAWGTEWPLFAPASNTWTGGLLTPARTYEFRIRASTWEGRNSAWTTKTVTMPINAPTGLSVARTAANKCTLNITDPQGGVFWRVQQRQVGATAWTSLGAVGTKTPWYAVTSGVRYDYRVQAYSDYGSSAWTTATRCGL